MRDMLLLIVFAGIVRNCSLKVDSTQLFDVILNIKCGILIVSIFKGFEIIIK